MPWAARFECGSGLVVDAIWISLVSVALVVSACRRRAPRARAGHILDAAAATDVRRRVVRSSQFPLLGGIRRARPAPGLIGDRARDRRLLLDGLAAQDHLVVQGAARCRGRRAG